LSRVSHTPSIYPLPLHDALPIFKDAEAHAAEDEERRKNADARNTLEQLVYQGEKLLSDNEDKISEADRTKAEDSIKEAKETLARSEEHTSELQSRFDLVCRLLLE